VNSLLGGRKNSIIKLASKEWAPALKALASSKRLRAAYRKLSCTTHSNYTVHNFAITCLDNYLS
jgi:hypothetical protein